MTGLVITGTGNGSQTFQMPNVVGGDGLPLAFQGGRGVWNYPRYGLLQWIQVGPRLFDTQPLVGGGLPSAPADQIARICAANSNPIRIGQTLTITDANNAQVEVWSVINVALTPMGAQQPQWRGQALPTNGPIAPSQ
jgi:hypothetical protein